MVPIVRSLTAAVRIESDTFTLLVSSTASNVDDPPYMVETSTGSVDITSLSPQAIYARVREHNRNLLLTGTRLWTSVSFDSYASASLKVN